ncbi:pentapeptide repeat-containing protein [Metapseudomonas otitidis]|uniref:pentapeptide repeat-containing protein n=1 Tax=Metapseudomonas otitidis TaxID=319939 RepID=UPI0040556743
MTYTAKLLAEILGKHSAWLEGDDGGELADLRGADLRSADLRYANLRGANLSGANLRYANLRDADLRDADLRYANLSSANLSGANLSGADLSGADLRDARSLWGVIGNLSEIKSVQCDLWPVTYTAEHMQIGCQLHLLSEWWAFGDEEISRMDSEALEWWKVWKPILKKIIKASPAFLARRLNDPAQSPGHY